MCGTPLHELRPVMKYSDSPSLSLPSLVSATGDGVIIRADSPCLGVDDESMCAGSTELSIPNAAAVARQVEAATVRCWALLLLLWRGASLHRIVSTINPGGISLNTDEYTVP